MKVNGARVTVGCVHLDSGKASARLRERQLAAIFEATARERDVVLLGDFNMRDHEDGGIDPGTGTSGPACGRMIRGTPRTRRST